MPPAPDWYRRQTWTPTDEAEFNARLKRSRQDFHRCQYLVIQAGELHRTGDPELLLVAIALTRRAITEYPHPMFLAGAFLTQAEALADLGRHEEAIESFRGAVIAQRAYPGVKHLTHLSFGQLATALGRRDLYPEIERLFSEFADSDDMFPANAFRSHYIQALFAEARGELSAAKEHAQTALASAEVTQTQFRYHRSLGLFRGCPPEVLDALRRLTTA